MSKIGGNRTMPGYQTGPDNRLVSDGTYNYTYDNEGNTLTKTRVSDGQVTTFSWDYRNRLTEAVVKTSGGVTVDDEKFTYDANDHRIGVWANGAQQSWTVYDGDTPYLDFTGAGAVSERYLSDPRAIDAFFAREDGAGDVAWLLTDKLGSVREVVDSGGNVLDAITYDSYGNILNETNAAAGGSFRFTAGAYDSALGLTYLWHRWYANGHWLSEDPLGLGPDSNPTRYVGNDPTNITDLSGLIDKAQLEEISRLVNQPMLYPKDQEKLKKLMGILINDLRKQDQSVLKPDDLKPIKAIIDVGKNSSKGPVKRILKFYSKGIAQAIKGLKKIDEGQYERYKSSRKYIKSIDDPEWHDLQNVYPQHGKRYEIMWQLEQIEQALGK